MELVVSLVSNLPTDPDRPLEVLIREQVKQRGIDQNGLYWRRLADIAEQAYFEGKRYSKDVWHIYLCKEEMPEEIVTRDGEIRSKWVELPDGSLTVISTTQLSKASFAEYTTIVEAFGAGLGVRFTVRES